MSELSRAEETVLLAILRLGDEAYGVSIRKVIRELSGKDYAYGTLYGVLDQMVRKEYVWKVKGEPTHERGGRGKTYYRLTREGVDELRSALEFHQSVWKGISAGRLERIEEV
ncbi:MAG TPA: PadR family transcriptional regulator [Candidatus Krumholzibacterium sp.]|nr:PadR family transcriptional regulator [Candidatus Krumholzibacterium sp.]